uniref:Uncharacterized protein n=1 Tax=Cucumis melo TaxID=3656 RepID=A0A9I9EL80_CUCME
MHDDQGQFEHFLNGLESMLTVYWTDCNNSNLIRIVDDKHVSWIMLVISKFSDNDLLVVFDTVSATDIGNTLYLRENVKLL